MKKLLLPLSLILLFSCTKKDSPKPSSGNNNNDSTVINDKSDKHFITYWLEVPLLNQWDKHDTIFCHKSGDTSYIIYKGRKLYVWDEQTKFWDSINLYTHCYIGAKCYDTASAYSKAWINPGKYYDFNDSVWRIQEQSIWIFNRANFDTTGEGIYMN
jgi:hypothetical protein